MTYPYCKKALLEGYIPTQSLEWVPKYGEPKLKYNENKNEGFRMGKHSFLDAKRQIAFYCDSCEKIIIDCIFSSETASKIRKTLNPY